MQGKGNERAQNKKRNGESGQESAETQRKEGTAPRRLHAESCSQPQLEAKLCLLRQRASQRVPGEACSPGCDGYRAREGGTTGDFARGGTAMRQSEDILLDLKEMIFLCPPNVCLTSSWSRKRGEEHRYDICRYQHRWSHRYDKTPQNDCASRQKHSIWASLCYSCCISRARTLAPAPLLQPGTLNSPSGGDQETASLATLGNEA